MTPKEKALKLLYKMNNQAITIQEWEKASDYAKKDLKRKALIAVCEILDFMFLSENENSFWINYYNKVKQEIEKL